MHKLTAYLGVMLASVAFTCSALVAHSKAGMWQETGYRVEPNGTNLPCEMGSCLGPSTSGADYSKICAPADALSHYADDHLAQLAKLLETRSKNCKTASSKESDSERDSELECDGISLTRHVNQPDDEHLNYEFIIRNTAAGPAASTLRAGAKLVWLNSDCTGAGMATANRTQPDVRFGSKAAIQPPPAECPLCANSGHGAVASPIRR
jgi:hypothetical protein